MENLIFLSASHPVLSIFMLLRWSKFDKFEHLTVSIILSLGFTLIQAGNPTHNGDYITFCWSEEGTAPFLLPS